MKKSLPTFLLAALGALLAVAQPSASQVPEAVVITIDSAIGPGTARLVRQGLDQAVSEGARVVVLQMDTPGGLDTSMRDIVRAILASPVPVLGYVGPSGARAASAGTFILYATHVAGMAPGTNLGAATPVPLGGGSTPAPDAGVPDRTTEPAPREAGANKAVNDAVAYVRSLADLRKRNADWAEEAVRDAASLPAAVALAQGVIDVLATDVADLLQQADGREVQIGQGTQRLETDGLEVRHLAVGWLTRALTVLANPNLALVLLMVGVYGLLFEFMAPGALVPGVVGGIALVLGLYAISVLPLNLAGVALLLLGMGLLLAEAFAPSFGILGLGGVLALVLGAGVLIDDPGSAWLAPSLPLVAGMGLCALAASVLVLRLAVRGRRLRSHSGAQALIGELATVMDWSAPAAAGHVQLAGERWQAVGEAGLQPGQPVRVVAVQGLRVQVSADAKPPPNLVERSSP